jgi:drug/metabolite transporter (DMT)-like permease
MDRTGIAAALFAAFLFGASTPLAKVLLGTIDPWVLAGVLYLGAGLALAAVVLVRPAGAGAPLRRTDIPRLALVVAFGGVLGPLLLMSGLARTDAATASLLLNVEGLATLAIAWVVFHEGVDRRLAAGALAILAGGVVLAWQGGASPDPGALLIVGACVCWGIDNNVSRTLTSADPVALAMVKGLAAGVVNLAAGLAIGGALPPPPPLVLAALVGAAGYGASLVLYLIGQRHLGAARTGAYFALAPFAGAVLAVVAFGDPVTVPLVLAGGLMALGLWFHLTERHEHLHEHAALEHEHRHVHDEHHRHEHAEGTPPGVPHSHPHRHEPLVHSHPHYPDLHHRHRHARTL